MTQQRLNFGRGDPLVAKQALRNIFAMLDGRPIVDDEDVPPEPEIAEISSLPDKDASLGGCS